MDRSHRVWRLAVALATSTSLLAVSVSVSVAGAAEEPPTRAQYVERVEPICRSATEANRTVLKGVDEMVREDELQPAGRRFGRAAAALGAAVQRLAQVPRPAADDDRLGEWLGYGQTGRELLGRLGRVLREGKRAQVDGLANQLLRTTKRANALVVGFDFDYCRLSPARFV